MVRTPSTMAPLGMQAPDFHLPDTTGHWVSRDDFRDASALLVMFICNHCPFVAHIRGELAQLGRDYPYTPHHQRTLGSVQATPQLAIVAINANDAETYQSDRPEMMVAEVREAGYTFPYLFDADQSVAKAYHAACTPDFFLFDQHRALVYRGQFDGSRPGNGIPVTGSDVRHAIDAVLHGAPVSSQQTASIGCNIKWRPGNEPAYFG